MPGEHIEDCLAVALAAALDRSPEDDLGAVVVRGRPEHEARVLAGAVDRPAGEGPRHLGDVALGVAAVDAQRVQLHQLARVVLVEPGEAPLVRTAAHAPQSGRVLSQLSR